MQSFQALFAKMQTTATGIIGNFNPTTRNFMCGMALGYAAQQEKLYQNVILAFLFPSIYSGFHVYYHRNELAHWVKAAIPRPKIKSDTNNTVQ